MYSDAFIQQYSGRPKIDVPPHLFGIAEDAYRCMLREGKNQTIIVSGESGAGKTVSAKYIMRYFATVEDPDKPRSRKSVGGGRTDGMSRTEEQIIATNPIMEAFGNAKTTRNDNSSRFGKYIEIMFDKKADIIGAKIRTYLLERSRLNFQAPTERNYHIFYQLCEGLGTEQKAQLGLTQSMDFRYLSQGGDPKVKNVDDAKDFAELCVSLETIGVSAQTQSQIWRVLAAILHLGNVEIHAASVSRPDAVLSASDPHLKQACELLGVDSAKFGKWIVKQSRKVVKENLESPRSTKDAIVVRDSISKFLYNSLFEWLVRSVNGTLATKEVLARVKTFIGVLDIYGFEHFQTNSFEQFCINYANEKLQQEFTSHVFKLEQDEYVKEGIPWEMIDFADNQPCIDMIENRSSGILSLLDEQSKLGTGSDEVFRQTLVEKLKSNSNFDAPKLKNNSFTIKHYALPVTYDSEGFLEKNRDTVSEQHLDALQNSENPFVQEVLKVALGTDSAGDVDLKKPGKAVKKPTLGAIFKSSLIQLMETIGSTNAHYIRCIKPNEAKTAWQFEPKMVMSQLTACGVLETIRISCAGFPSRWTFLELGERYYSLIPSSHWEQVEDHKNLSEMILKTCIPDKTKYQIGLTKIFFKPGVLADLEKLRTKRLDQCATVIQTRVRAWLVYAQFARLKKVVVVLQSRARTVVARKQVESLRSQHRHATIIQCFTRGWLARASYVRSIREKASTRIQALLRGYILRRSYQRTRCAAITCQKLIRGNAGRRQAKQAKKDRGTVEAFKQKNSGLEQKIMSQAQDIQRHRSEASALQSQVVQLRALLTAGEEDRSQSASVVDQLGKDLKAANDSVAKNRAMANEVAKTELLLRTAEQERDQLRIRSQQLEHNLQEKDDRLQSIQNEADTYRRDSQSLQQEINAMKDEIRRLAGSGSTQPDRQLSIGAHNGSNGHAVISRGRTVARQSITAGQVLDNLAVEGHGADNRRPSNVMPSALSKNAAVSSMNGTDSLLSTENHTEQIMSILEDDDLMNNEIMYGMIQSLKIPQPSLQTPPSEADVLFPAQLINLVVSEMWKFGFIKESERFLANVMQSIQQQVMTYEGEECINPGAFWLSNVHEILSFVWLAETDILNPENTDMDDTEWQEYDRLISIVKHDLESLEFNIYHTWMKELKKRLHKMIIPATIESQSLPGFITSESSRFFGKLLQSNQPGITMDDLLNHFNKVFKAMKSFYLEPSVIHQTMTELLKLVGVTAFNDLLMRRNFLSWKRGLQINYNITRVEEWCKSHDLPDGTLQLEHLMQATKLLQLKKGTLADIEILYDICWCLSHRQINKLINQYYPADYESPLSPDILKAVSSRVTNEESTEILLDAVALDDSGSFEIADARDIKLATPYVPSYLSLLRIKMLLKLIQESQMSNGGGSPELGQMQDYEETV